MELDVLEGGSCLINNIRLSIYDFYLRNIKKPTCCKCGQVAILQNDDGSWICEQCAQVMSDLGEEYDDQQK